MVGIALAAVVVCGPLLLHPTNVPPPDGWYGFDLMTLYGFANAARTTILHFGQFPLRSPWHGGGHPTYVNPDDVVFTPTMPLVLAVGPWAAYKIDFVVTMIVGGVGMFLLTRRRMGYPLVGALLSATTFALGGFLLGKWLLGWRPMLRSVWLPLILYALWRGRCWRMVGPARSLLPAKSLAGQDGRHPCANPRGLVPRGGASPCRGGRWLALAVGLVAWFFLDQKYTVIVMGWFLMLVGLLRLDEEQPDKVSEKVSDPLRQRGLTPSSRHPRLAWGYFGLLAGVWVFGAGLAAVKLVPMWPHLRRHLRYAPVNPWETVWWHPLLVWVPILIGLGLTPWLARLVGTRGRRLAGLGGIIAVLAAVLLAVAIWAPRPPNLSTLWIRPPTNQQYVREVFDWTVSYGTWQVNASGIDTPFNQDRFHARSPVGPIVAVLAVLAVVLRPRRTWKWAILAGLYLTLQLSPALPRDLAQSWGRLPLLSWMRRPREAIDFYCFFLLTLLAGRALDLPGWLRRRRPCRVGVWVVLGANVVFLASMAWPRFAYSVSMPLPKARAWGPYRLVERRCAEWRDRLCLLVRENVGLQWWDLEFRDQRHEALEPSHFIDEDGALRPNTAFKGFVRFDDPDNAVEDWTFTPNEIGVRVTVRRPGVLHINQIRDRDWRPSVGDVLPEGPLLRVRLARIGTYTVRLRYVPRRLYVGLLVSALTAVVGTVLLVLSTRRGRVCV